MVDESDGIVGGRARVAQTRLAERSRPARAHTLERVFARALVEFVSLLVDAAYAFERERDAATVVAHARESVAATLRDEDESAAAAAHADDSTGHDLAVEPAHERFAARVRRVFEQARARARKSFESARDIGREVAARLGEFRPHSSLGLQARAFESREFFDGVAAREAPLGDVAHLRERLVGVEQVEQRRVGRAELTFERVGFGFEERGELLRILMKSGRGDDEADAVASASSGAARHLLKLGGG